MRRTCFGAGYPVALPSFDQSAMDGYAFCFADWQQNPLTRRWWTAAGQFPEPLIRAPPEGFLPEQRYRPVLKC